ncbi:MAG TPA: thiamine pyrophosphate-dependent enzyme [Bacteroidales bacterium]|nr:thiamine pyrophosphate-dependent enzyme [Bacteroidales bacterium]
MDSTKDQFDKEFISEALSDYRIAFESRQASLLGRREVLTGKAKFGIFGDGKEVPQLAMAKVFQNGDWRSGYYRDQTFMLATGMLTLESFFSQLYGDTDLEANPDNGGRMMNNHFATRSLHPNGEWKDLTAQKNSSADISPTAGQMPRLLGLALASKIFRCREDKENFTGFSQNGNEVAFGTIGDASTSEGHFFETVNAAAVLQVPMALSVWDDGYGISVPRDMQTAKNSISQALEGMKISQPGERGILIYTEKAWNYPGLLEMYKKGVAECRTHHVPVLFHVTEVTQPQGHSTSGSHERYKSRERLEWEKEYDCLRQMRLWILETGMATAEALDEIETNARERVKQAQKKALDHFQKPLLKKRQDFIKLVNIEQCNCMKAGKIDSLLRDLGSMDAPIRKDIISAARRILLLICHNCSGEQSLKLRVTQWLREAEADNTLRYSSHLYSESAQAAIKAQTIRPVYREDSPWVNGREILVANYDLLFSKYPDALIFGEDVGNIGGVNQTLEGLQKKFGELRIADTGIRETTIIGQGLGMAMRGLRPIAEIQYFDYLLFGLQVLSDDLATLRYRTVGGQKAPLIVSTRGHRLEGIWHSGSPMGMLINAVRGIYVLVPRDMTRAAAFYNTLMKSDDPAIVIEPLNGYRLKERMPSNLPEITLELGKPEILAEGSDITLVTYGACVRIAQDAIGQLTEYGISVELIDVQTLIPFDTSHTIVQSLRKTNKIVFFDEDVPGGATAFMMQKVLEEQGGYVYLDAEPATITAKEHRPAYSSDGDYFSNPNAEDVFEKIYRIMNEYNPGKYPVIF